MQGGIFLKSSYELPKKFQPSKPTIGEVTAILAKSKIPMQDGVILETSHEVQKKETIQLGKWDYSEKFDDPSLLGSGKDLLIFKIFRKLLKWAN